MPRQIIDAAHGTDLVGVGAKANANFAELYGGTGPVPAWIKVGIALTFATFSAAALTNSINLFQLAPGQIIQGTKIKHLESFAGGAIIAYAISVGIMGTPDRHASAFDVFQTPGSRIYQLSQNFDGEDTLVPTQITATATSVGANLNAALTGVVDIWALLSVPS